MRSTFRLILAVGILAASLYFRPATAHAVVGQAEHYDDFKQEDLEDFHDRLVHEEQRQRLEKSDETREMLKQKLRESRKMEGKDREIADKDVEALRKELLDLPKRDRFRAELDGRYQFDSNIVRLPPPQEKSDSIFKSGAVAAFDLSGKKTDLRFELGGAREWNIHFPANDYWLAEERVRYRRKYFRKISHSIQSRVARTVDKTVEIDQKRVRWDSFQNTAFNYAISRKLSVNLEANMNHRIFTAEPFDQDSAKEFTLAPSAFWNFTPKSRVALGYQYGANRIETKSSNTDAHEIHGGYFGKVTNKSSVSFDVSYSHQTPRSLDAPTVNTTTTGAGYIWQLRPKTQLTLQVMRSLQNTTSNRVEGTENQTTKSDSHFTNDSLTLSLNQRFTSKLTLLVTANASHTSTKVFKNGDKDSEGQQFLFPCSMTFNYFVSRWMRLTLAYTYAYRTGDEKPDTFHAHNILAGMHWIL